MHIKRTDSLTVLPSATPGSGPRTGTTPPASPALSTRKPHQASPAPTEEDHPAQHSQPSLRASKTPLLAKLEISPASSQAKALRERLQTFLSCAPTDTRARESALFLLAHFKDISGRPEARLHLCEKLAQAVPEKVAEGLDELELPAGSKLHKLACECGIYALAQPGKFASGDVNWYQVLKGVIQNQSDNFAHIMVAASVLQNAELGLSEGQQVGLARMIARLSPRVIGEVVHQFNFPELVRYELALIYFSAREAALTSRLDDFNLEDPALRCKAAIAAARLPSAEDLPSLKQYLLATLAIERAQGAGKSRVIEAMARVQMLVGEAVSMIDPRGESAQARSKSKALAAFRSSKADDVKQALKKSENILLACLGAPVDRLLAAAGQQEQAQLNKLRNLVFFIRTSSLARSGNEDDTIKLLSKLRPIFEYIHKIPTDEYRYDLLDGLLSLPAEVLSGFDPCAYPVAGAALPALLLGPLKVPFLAKLFTPPGSASFEDQGMTRQWNGLCLKLATSGFDAHELGSLLRALLPGLPDEQAESAVRQAKEKVDEASRAAAAAEKAYRDAPKDGKQAAERSKNEAKKELKEAQKRLQGTEQAHKAAAKATVSRTLQQMQRLLVALRVAPEATRLALAAGAGSGNGEAALEQVLKKIVLDELDVAQDQYEKYRAIFDAYRDPSTVLTYFGQIRETAALPALKQFIASCIAGQFPAQRYEGDALLQELGEDVERKWRANREKPLLRKGKDSRLHMVFSDDPQDLMRMGSDVAGSCQRVDGNACFNQGLIGAVWDGKEKPIAIKDKDGRILGRVILRLMRHTPEEQDEGTPLAPGKPACLIEKAYPPNISDDDCLALLEFGREIAGDLGAELYYSAPLLEQLPGGAVGATTPLAGSLQSGRLAWSVYSDAGDGLQKQAFVLQEAALSAS